VLWDMCLGIVGAGSECTAEHWVAISFVSLLCVLFIVAGAWWAYYNIRLFAWISQNGNSNNIVTEEPLPSPADEADAPPLLLCVESSTAMRCCEGEYDLVERHSRGNRKPCWVKKDGSRLIQSGSDGHWYIARHRGDNSTDCIGGALLVCSQRPHDGVFPHQVAGGWTVKCNFHWRVDPSIAVQTPVALFKEDLTPVDPEMMEIDLNDQSVTACSKSLMCTLGNSGLNHSTVDIFSDLSTVASSTLVVSAQRSSSLDNVETALAMSYQKTGLQYFEQTVADAPPTMRCDTLTPRARPVDPPILRRLPARQPPQALLVSVPSPQSSCSGLYVLVPNEQPNGHPLWRQTPASACWLFCSPSGRWCIGGADVQRECFSRGAGYVYQTCLSGPDVFPHDCVTPWQLWDSDNKAFRRDSAVEVSQVDLPSWDNPSFLNSDAKSCTDKWAGTPN